MSKEIVFVCGHKNPDSDSICAAITYADYINRLGKYDAVPVRLGELSKETEYILQRFYNVPPVLISTVKQTVEDLDYDKVTVFSKEITLKTAWSLMKSQNMKSAPVCDEHYHLLGLLSATNILEGYMDNWDASVLKKAHTPIENVIDTLEARILYLDKSYKTVQGDVVVAAMTGDEVTKRINEHDIVLVGGGRDDVIEDIIKSKPDLIILTGSLTMSDETLEKCKNAHVNVVSTSNNTFFSTWEIIKAIPVEYAMQKGDITSFNEDDTVSYVREIMSTTRFRSYPVTNYLGRVVGSISRFQVLNGKKKKIIQVDHNERGQAVDGIEEAEILEIVDHHRVADIQTIGPVLFRAEPVGCTCTIIAKCYKESGIDIPPEMAGLMLGAILSDTLIFKSPTCTPTDVKVAHELAAIADVNAEEFGIEMFRAGTSLVGKTVEEIFNQDFKEFKFGGDSKVGVAQTNTMDIEGFKEYKKDMLDYMNNLCNKKGYDFLLLLLTDVINATSEAFVAGPEKEKVEDAFNVKLVEDQASLVGVVSRKKQVVPAITDVMTA